MHLISLIKDLEQLTNPLQNSLRYIIIDSFSTVCYPIADITEFDFWISEIVKIFKILISKYFIGILVIRNNNNNDIIFVFRLLQ